MWSYVILICRWGKRAAHNRAQIVYYIAENLELRKCEVSGRIAAMTGRQEADCTREVELAIQRLFYWGAYADKYGGTVQVRTGDDVVGGVQSRCVGCTVKMCGGVQSRCVGVYSQDVWVVQSRCVGVYSQDVWGCTVKMCGVYSQDVWGVQSRCVGVYSQDVWDVQSRCVGVYSQDVWVCTVKMCGGQDTKCIFFTCGTQV